MTKKAGRIIGMLFLVQGMIAPLTNFVLLGPAMSGPGGFLPNAAAHSTGVQIAALLSLMTGALWVAIVLTALPVFRQYSHAMAHCFLALGIVTFGGLVFEGIAVRSLLALSQEFAKTDGADVALFHAVAAPVRSLRNSAHYTNLLLGGVSFLVLYGFLFRFALIPRALSAFGLVTVGALIAGALIPLSGYPTVMSLFMPMGLSQLAVVIWLLIRGFEERPYAKRPVTPGAEPP